MMLSQLLDYLDTKLVDTPLYDNTLDKNTNCVGVYNRGKVTHPNQLGASSYEIEPLSILVHWGESSSGCRIKAKGIYDTLRRLNNINLESYRIIHTKMLDSNPVDLVRDSNNICEMIIRCHVVYAVKDKEGTIDESTII